MFYDFYDIELKNTPRIYFFAHMCIYKGIKGSGVVCSWANIMFLFVFLK